VLLFNYYYAFQSLQCLTGLQNLPEEVGDMGVTLKSGVQAGRAPDFALEIGSLMVLLPILQDQA
jgi:hypothetical protein